MFLELFSVELLFFHHWASVEVSFPLSIFCLRQESLIHVSQLKSYSLLLSFWSPQFHVWLLVVLPLHTLKLLLWFFHWTPSPVIFLFSKHQWQLICIAFCSQSTSSCSIYDQLSCCGLFRIHDNEVGKIHRGALSP